MLGSVIRTLRKRVVLIVTVTLLFVAGASALTALTTEKYEATAQVFVSTAGADDVTQLAQGNTFTQARVQSYVDVATSPSVTEPVASRFQGLSSSQVAEKISADAPLNKVLINLHVTDENADRAASLANAVAAQFNKVVESIELSTSGASQVKLTVIQPATVPASPISPRPLLNIGAGLFLGLILGVLAAFAREATDNTFKSIEQWATQSDVPVLAVVPLDRKVSQLPLAFRGDSHGRRAEAFRQLRASLQFVDIDNPPKVIAVTSSLPGEGKSHAAVNLAAALAEAGKRVCLIECDLRRPTIGNLLGLVSGVGLTSVLIGEAPVEEVVQNAGKNFAVLTSGPIPPNPAELLASSACRSLIESISAQVDSVVLDTAPISPVVDGVEVALMADATLFCVRYGRTTKDQARRALDQLAKVGIRPIGVALSMASKLSDSSSNYYYYKEQEVSGPSSDLPAR